MRAVAWCTLAAVATAVLIESPAGATDSAATDSRATSTVGARAEPPGGTQPDVEALVESGRAQLDAAVSSARALVGAEQADGIRSERLDELAAALGDAITAAEEALPYEGADRVLFTPGVSDPSLVAAASDARVIELAAAVRAWEHELAAQRQRIEEERRRIEEERRRAEEEAQRRAADAAARAAVRPPAAAAGTRSAPAAAPAPPETAEQRVARLMAASPAAHLGFDLNPSCQSPAAYACYYGSANWIRITPNGLRLSDCQLLRVIAHEYRHYVQWATGAWQIVDGVLVNAAWTEADARAWSSQYGCFVAGA